MTCDKQSSFSSLFLSLYMLYATDEFYISQVETFCKLYLSMIRSTTNQQKFFLSDHRRMYAKILTTWMNRLFICKIMRNVAIGNTKTYALFIFSCTSSSRVLKIHFTREVWIQCAGDINWWALKMFSVLNIKKNAKSQ